MRQNGSAILATAWLLVGDRANKVNWWSLPCTWRCRGSSTCVSCASEPTPRHIADSCGTWCDRPAYAASVWPWVWTAEWGPGRSEGWGRCSRDVIAGVSSPAASRQSVGCHRQSADRPQFTGRRDGIRSFPGWSFSRMRRFPERLHEW